MKLIRLLLIVLFSTVGIAFAQEDTTVTVPDVTGLTLPVATAELNRAGLRVGTQISLPWTEDSGLEPGAVAEQSFAPEDVVPYGTAVDLTILRANNAVLIYDDNDITLVNQSNGTFNLSTLSFESVESGATFNASRWSTTLQSADCAQLWSVARTGPKDVPECQESTLWLTTNDPNQHFWTGAGGTTAFTVIQAGVERGTCPVSTTGRCEIYLDSTGLANVLPYVYFAYTTDRWVVFNNAETDWMSVENILLNTVADAPGGPLLPVQEADNPDAVVGNPLLLAPQQCVLYRPEGVTADELPVECDLVASFTLESTFWNTTLYVTGNNDDVTSSCPPATAGRLTLCVLPR